MNTHEWITVRGIVICHWCGVSKRKHQNTLCKSNVKIITTGNKLKLEWRKNYGNT